MSESYVALLRGINVGRAKRIAMADLRELFERLGYSEVRTLLNSGNVVFCARPAKAMAGRIETAIEQELGVESRVTVLSTGDLAVAIRDNPLVGAARDFSRLQVTFLRQPADRMKLAPLAMQRWAPEAFAVGARVAYLWCPAGTIESALHLAVSRALRDAATTRNWATVTKLHALTEALKH